MMNAKRYTNRIQIRIAGIPASVAVLSFSRGRPGNRCGHPDTWSPPEYPEVEFAVCDRRGYPAPWLERLMDRQEHDRITAALLAA